MAYVVAPTLKPQAYIAREICGLSVREGMSTRHGLDTKIDGAILTKIFESSNIRKFLKNKCPGLALTVSFHQKSNKITIEYEISFAKEGIDQRSKDMRPLHEKISDIKASLLKNVSLDAVKSFKE